jgi:hypothetical protein
MRHSRWVNLTVAIMILVGSSLLYPAAAQSPMCGMFAHDFLYWDQPDANGNCPIGYVNLVGERAIDCDGNVIQWGTTASCEVERSYWYCGDCQIE